MAVVPVPALARTPPTLCLRISQSVHNDNRPPVSDGTTEQLLNPEFLQRLRAADSAAEMLPPVPPRGPHPLLFSPNAKAPHRLLPEYALPNSWTTEQLFPPRCRQFWLALEWAELSVW